MYEHFIKPFLYWIQMNQIQTFVDVVGDILFVFMAPLIMMCAIKYLRNTMVKTQKQELISNTQENKNLVKSETLF